MKQWQRDLDYIRLVGPDEPRFDAAVKRLNDYIERVGIGVSTIERDVILLRSTMAKLNQKIRP